MTFLPMVPSQIPTVIDGSVSNRNSEAAGRREPGIYNELVIYVSKIIDKRSGSLPEKSHVLVDHMTVHASWTELAIAHTRRQ